MKSALWSLLLNFYYKSLGIHNKNKWFLKIFKLGEAGEINFDNKQVTLERGNY